MVRTERNAEQVSCAARPCDAGCGRPGIRVPESESEGRVAESTQSPDPGPTNRSGRTAVAEGRGRILDFAFRSGR